MFKGKTAWFSKSCMEKAVNLWGENGGEFTDFSVAQYIFSDDLEYEDTKSLLNSEEYLNQHLTIFVSSFVVDAVSNSLDKTCLGKFYLTDPHISKTLSAQRAPDMTEKENTHKEENENSSNINFENIPHVRYLPKVIGLLRSLMPGEDGVEVLDSSTAKKCIVR